MKKILCVLLVVLMCLTAAPLGGFAELDFGVTASALSTTGKCGKNATYTFDSATGRLVISGTGAIAAEAFYQNQEIKNVIISDGITEIGTDAFRGSSITSVTIPDSVTTIGDSAFAHCYSLTIVTIPDSVTTIGAHTFLWCGNLTNVTIGNSVITIGDSAFAGCDRLTGIIIPDSVTSIAYGAFQNCGNLTSVTIPNSITNIGGSAFYNCTSLESINIPKSVTYIGNEAFRYCSSLYDVYYEGSEENWNAIDIRENNTGLENAEIHFGEVMPECQHEYLWVARKVSTCTETGWTGHFVCKGCNAFFKNDADKTETTLEELTMPLDLANHEGFYKEIEGTKTPATCVATGSVKMECACGDRKTVTLDIDATAHDLDDLKKIDDAKHGKKCKREGCTYVAGEAAHAYTETTHKTLPNCVTEGSETKKCACGDTKTETLPVNDNHDWGAFTEIKAPTCTEIGIKERACKREGCTAKDMVEIILATEHTYSEEKVITITPTCTSEGKKAIICVNCGEKKSGTEEVVPPTHSYPDKWSVVIAPDCQNTGFAVKVCFSCHDVIAQTVPKAGHADLDGDSKCDTCEMIIVVEPEEPTEPDTPNEPEEKPCDCDCHAGGIKAFFFKLINFFAKIFDKSARVCECGSSH